MVNFNHSDSEIEKHGSYEIILFENRVSDLMFAIASKLSRRARSMQMMKDDDFVHRRDRQSNDIHAFLELENRQFFHIRAYTRHMLDMEELPTTHIFLTGYVKGSVTQTGGVHSLRQAWYPWDADVIANEVLAQNTPLFQQKSN